MAIKAIICGATGYTGLEIIKLLLNHKDAEITDISAKIDEPQKISDVFPELKGRFDMLCEDKKVDALAKAGADVVFLALPHRVSMYFAEAFLKKGIKVIDLSADFRLKDANVYKKFYAQEHKYKDLIKTSVYGLPELNSGEIKQAKLIANPGCYPTVSILSLAPLVSKKAKDIKDIIIDAKTGITGAGRKAALALNFGEVAENMKAYKIGVHQHVPEIDQELSTLAKKNISVLFVPHLAPMKRGILATIYIKLTKAPDTSDVVKMYKNFYKNAPFVRVYDEGDFPETKNVYDTNFCDIGITTDGDRVIIVGAIDNLIKGASGQAVQNMNIIFGLDETSGLL